MDTTCNQLLGGALQLHQPLKGYRFGIDAVLLAAAVKAKPDQTILDVGTGVGAVLTCIAARVPGSHLTGLEVQPELVQLANQNIKENLLSEHAQVLQGSIHRPPKELGPNSFEHVVSNPPYLADETSQTSPYLAKSLSHHGDQVSLEAWVSFCMKMVKPGGQLTLIHRADHLAKLLSVMETKMGGIAVFPLWPKHNTPAKRILIRGKKGSKSPIKVLPGLVLHDEDGTYAPDIDSLLKAPSPIDW